MLAGLVAGGFVPAPVAGLAGAVAVGGAAAGVVVSCCAVAQSAVYGAVIARAKEFV